MLPPVSYISFDTLCGIYHESCHLTRQILFILLLQKLPPKDNARLKRLRRPLPLDVKLKFRPRERRTKSGELLLSVSDIYDGV